MLGLFNGTWYPEFAEGYDTILRTIGFNRLQISGGHKAHEVFIQTDTTLEIRTAVSVFGLFTVSQSSKYTLGELMKDTDPQGNAWESVATYDGKDIRITSECHAKGFKNDIKRSLEGDLMTAKYEFTHPGGILSGIRQLRKKS